jgi:two-component system sensor histidine kinase BaeS
MRRFGFGVHIAAASIGVSALALAIVAVGVQRVGGGEFEQLMVQHGSSVAAARDMFQSSVTWVLIAAVAAAVSTTLFLAASLARWMARPVMRVSEGAARLAAGEYDLRLSETGPREVRSLARSFNQLAADLEQQDRFRQEFIENAAHELRTPLTNLQGYLEALRDGVITPGRDVFASLHEEVERLVRLSASLESTVRGVGREPSPRPTDVVSAASTAVEAVRPLLERRSIRISVSTPGSALAFIDSDHLAEVLSNLLHNAARYADDGGEVHVRVRADARRVTTEVVNSGPGIPADDLERVFERFYRVDRSRDRASGGAGLGLAIVKLRVMSAGGAVTAESRPGRTCFSFWLPATSVVATLVGVDGEGARLRPA